VTPGRRREKSPSSGKRRPGDGAKQGKLHPVALFRSPSIFLHQRNFIASCRPKLGGRPLSESRHYPHTKMKKSEQIRTASSLISFPFLARRCLVNVSAARSAHAPRPSHSLHNRRIKRAGHTRTTLTLSLVLDPSVITQKKQSLRFESTRRRPWPLRSSRTQ
jgi:hypothetical protein